MTTSHYCLQLKPIPLANGETLVLEDARGVVIDATSGLLWVTVTGEPGDVFLSPGQSYCVMGRGRVVIEGATKSPVGGATESLSELRVHCPTAFLWERARPFLDRMRTCTLTTALRTAHPPAPSPREGVTTVQPLRGFRVAKA